MDGSGSDTPRITSMAALVRAQQACERCDLHRIAPRVVPGAGLRRARMVLVGEQPGDREDLAGLPFVGPAGGVLDEALEAAGIDRGEVFLTNAVKRFRHHEQALAGGGVRRIHDKPSMRQVRACRVWLDAELDLVAPEAVVLLGATAVQSLLGPQVRLGDVRGAVTREPGLPPIVATIHPAAALRMRTHEERAAARASLAADLSRARELLA